MNVELARSLNCTKLIQESLYVYLSLKMVDVSSMLSQGVEQKNSLLNILSDCMSLQQPVRIDQFKVGNSILILYFQYHSLCQRILVPSVN